VAITQYKAETFDIRDSLGYQLTTVRQEWLDALEKELAPLDLTTAQYIVIVKLGSNRAGTPADLCKAMQYDTGAMTRLLDRVEAKGLIKRVAHGADRRCVGLEITEEGKELYPRLIDILVKLNRKALKGFSKDEAASLERMLRRVALNLGD
jgi:MarR family transcriptional regulator, multiple antibiotic resistance protein MarR